MLATVTWPLTAMEMQVLPDCTTYSLGGSGVEVGMGVSVEVGVGETVGGRVLVAVLVSVARSATKGKPPLSAIHTKPAPISKTMRTNPNSAGSGTVTWDEVARRWLGCRPVVPVGISLKSVPQTRHLVAAAPTRVPHVGHKRGPTLAAELGDIGVLDIAYKRRGSDPDGGGDYTIRDF